MSHLNITDAELKKSATQFRKKLLIMPIIAAEQTLKHMSGRPGVAGREVVGQLSGTIELGPYDASRVDSNGVTITPRVLETYLGSVVKRFDVNEAAKTVWGTIVAQGEALKSADLAQQVLAFLSTRLGKGLAGAIWSAKRNDAGTTTKDLFDGFDTITEQEITNSKITTSEGNLHEFSAAITNTNAVDMLQSFYESAAPELQEQKTKLFLPYEVYNAYVKDYAVRFQSSAYNTQYKKTFLEGSNDLCELVPLASKKGSKFIHLSTSGNMLYGYGAGLADENITIEKYHEFLLSFVSTMYFGTQFESISSECLLVGKLHD